MALTETPSWRWSAGSAVQAPACISCHVRPLPTRHRVAHATIMIATENGPDNANHGAFQPPAIQFALDLTYATSPRPHNFLARTLGRSGISVPCGSNSSNILASGRMIDVKWCHRWRVLNNSSRCFVRKHRLHQNILKALFVPCALTISLSHRSKNGDLVNWQVESIWSRAWNAQGMGVMRPSWTRLTDVYIVNARGDGRRASRSRTASLVTSTKWWEILRFTNTGTLLFIRRLVHAARFRPEKHSISRQVPAYLLAQCFRKAVHYIPGYSRQDVRPYSSNWHQWFRGTYWVLVLKTITFANESMSERVEKRDGKDQGWDSNRRWYVL